VNVAAVEEHFRNLAKFIGDAGGSQKVCNELTSIATGLSRFCDYDWGKFSEFLARAEEYHRTGVLPVVAPTTRVKAAPKPPKPAAAEVIRKITSLYQNILNPSLTTESIDADLALLKGLKGAELLEVAQVVGVGEKVKKLKVGDMAEAIKQAIRDRRGMYRRPES
jgi:hypothetical protein